MRPSLAILVLLLSCVSLYAQQSIRPDRALNARADALSTAVEPKVVAWRRDFHQHPELSNREFRTAKIVAEHLQSLGLEVRTGVAHTGVVGVLRGGKPGPVVALRADMDALPVAERVDIPFKSDKKALYNGSEVGVMHACGHDAHTAILMGVAEVLSAMRDELAGTVVFVFQPAEEGPPLGEEGGASLMIKEGVLDDPKVDAMFGLHISAQAPVGTIRYREEGIMAAADYFYVDVHGQQSHGSQPWKGVDPIVVSSQIVQGFQTIVSRQMDLTDQPVVITVGKLESGVRENIIPELAVMTGTIRTLDTAMRRQVHERMLRTVEHIAASAGADAEIRFRKMTPVTYNDPALTRQMLPTLEKVAGTGNVQIMKPMTGAEDFGYYAEKVPSLFFFLGALPEGGVEATSAAHHTPDFYIDEGGFGLGVRAFCNLVLDYLEKG